MGDHLIDAAAAFDMKGGDENLKAQRKRRERFDPNLSAPKNLSCAKREKMK